MKAVNYRKQITNFIKTDLANHEIMVINHSDPTLVGIAGRIQAETKSLLHIQSGQSIIRMSKIHGKFQFTLDGRTLKIDGKILQGTPRFRAKKKHRNW